MFARLKEPQLLSNRGIAINGSIQRIALGWPHVMIRYSMGKITDIQWCHSTVNPTEFQCCGCELWTATEKICYAGRWAERIGGRGAFDKPVVLKPGVMARAAQWGPPTEKERAAKPWLPGDRRIIFLADMVDIFQPAIPFEFILNEVVRVADSQNGQRHIWMMLTKQAHRLIEFSDWLDCEWPINLWAGVSITSQVTVPRITPLLKLPSHVVTFVSYEPAWERISVLPWINYVDLVIMGGQSGPNSKPFDIGWARHISKHAGRHFFMKQLGTSVWDGERKLVLKDSHGGDWDEWPEDLRVRNFPVTAMSEPKEALLL